MALMGDKARLLETGPFVHAPDDGRESELPPPARDAADMAETADATESPEATEAMDEVGHRQAAAAGDPGAASMLGAMLLRRGDLDGAEPCLRAATVAGDRAAANNLGVLLHQRGYADEAAGWWRIAAVAGSAA
ncbi:sel1 repeat family protein, partial [Streptomyces sp. NPDC000151]